VRTTPRNLLRQARRAVSRREYPVVPAHLARIDYDGAEIVVGVTSRSEIMSRLRPRAKEPWTVRWIERSVGPGDVLYDVGANIGSYSLIAAAQPVDDVRVVAVEPGYASYAALCDNVTLNGFQGTVTPLPVVLSDRTGMVELAYRSTEPGAAEHVLGPGAPATYRQPVLSFRLDDLVSLLGLTAPTLLKVDVDGAERSVLAGAPRALASSGLRSVLIEIRRERSDEIVPLLEEAGFAVRERVEERDGQRLADVWYGIFERVGATGTMGRR
jgi:FkbM family methyltransferase